MRGRRPEARTRGGKEVQAELGGRADESGMLICGPNCLGVVNLVEHSCGYSSISPKDVAVGDVAVASQSGTVIVALVRSLRGQGFSHLISSGNEVVLTSGDYVSYLAAHPTTKVIGLLPQPRAGPGTRSSLLKAGRSVKGQAASFARTGSLAGSSAVHAMRERQRPAASA
jgi:acyl-CoA synthetase (NDP forming)